MHIAEQVEDEFEVHVFKLVYLRLRDTVCDLSGHSQRFVDQSFRQSALNLYRQLVK
jgi:hypothetical protein